MIGNIIARSADGTALDAFVDCDRGKYHEGVETLGVDDVETSANDAVDIAVKDELQGSTLAADAEDVAGDRPVTLRDFEDLFEEMRNVIDCDTA